MYIQSLLLRVFLYWIFSMDTEQCGIFEKRTARMFVFTNGVPICANYNYLRYFRRLQNEV